MSAPNWLTLSRLGLAGLLWVVPKRPAATVSVVALAAATDVLDGFVARRLRRHFASRGQRLSHADATVGEWLDPLCDKVFVLSLLGTLWARYRAPMDLILFIAARELLLVPLVAVYEIVPSVHRRRRYTMAAAPIGKLTTVTQLVATSLLAARHPLAAPCSVAAGLFGLVAGWHYLRRAPARSRPGSAIEPAPAAD